MNSINRLSCRQFHGIFLMELALANVQSLRWNYPYIAPSIQVCILRFSQVFTFLFNYILYIIIFFMVNTLNLKRDM